MTFLEFLRIFIHAARSLSLFAMTVYHKDEGFSSEKILCFIFRTYTLPLSQDSSTHVENDRGSWAYFPMMMAQKKNRGDDSPPVLYAGLCTVISRRGKADDDRPPLGLPSLAQVILDVYFGAHLQRAWRDRRRSRGIVSGEHLRACCTLGERVGALGNGF